MSMKKCEFGKGTDHQDWKYDGDTKQLINYKDNKCLTAAMGNITLSLQACKTGGAALNSFSLRVFVNDFFTDIAQKWTWDYTNITALQKIDNVTFDGKKFIGL